MYKTGKIRQSAWRDDFEQVCFEIFCMLEENDWMEDKNAINTERWVLRTKTAVAGDDVTSLRDELRQLRELMAAMTTIKSAMRTTTNSKSCNKCNVPHLGEWCYGEAIATGKLTMEQAAEKFPFITDPARRPAAATAVLKRYQNYQAQKGAQPQAGQARVRVCHDQGLTCYNVDLLPATSPAFAQGDGHMVLHMDSKCDQHMFNGMRWFSFGSNPQPKLVVETAKKCLPAIVPRGNGNVLRSCKRRRGHRVHQRAAGARP
eukprot:4737487-Pleurochrysis_carterae.AAC.1